MGSKNSRKTKLYYEQFDQRRKRISGFFCFMFLTLVFLVPSAVNASTLREDIVVHMDWVVNADLDRIEFNGTIRNIGFNNYEHVVINCSYFVYGTMVYNWTFFHWRNMGAGFLIEYGSSKNIDLDILTSYIGNDYCYFQAYGDINTDLFDLILTIIPFMGIVFSVIIMILWYRRKHINLKLNGV
ncbi:MAG: hypothetical protein ACTSUV_00335 [Candidatus Ranarchaeia archaeon]